MQLLWLSDLCHASCLVVRGCVAHEPSSRLLGARMCATLRALLEPACGLGRSVLASLEDMDQQMRFLRGCCAAFAFLAVPSVLGDCSPIPVSSDKKAHVLCVYAFAVVIPAVIHASVLLCCYCRCHVVSILDWVVNIRMCSAFSSCIRFHCSLTGRAG